MDPTPEVNLCRSSHDDYLMHLGHGLRRASSNTTRTVHHPRTSGLTIASVVSQDLL
jgi:hypothetical protein